MRTLSPLGAVASCLPFLFLAASCSGSSGTTPPNPEGGADGQTAPDANGDAKGGHHDAGDHDANTKHDAGTGHDSGASLTLLNDELSSGTRLKGKWLETADGFSELESLHDTVLDIDCAWGDAEDGMLRCLPTNVAERTYNNGVLYSDSSCSTPVYDVSSGNCSPAAGAFYTEDVPLCPSATRVFQIGAKATVTATYSKVSGSCASYGAPGPGDTYYALTPVGASTFLGGADMVAKGSGHLAPVFVKGGDASRSFRYLRDTTQSNTACDFATAQDGQLRCLPTTTLSVGTDFVDSSCTLLAAVGEATSCATLPFATSSTSGGCPTTTTVYATGAAVPAIYSTYGGGCSNEDITGPSFFAVDKVAKASSFTEGTRENVPGSSRVLAGAVTAGSLSVAATSIGQLYLYDSMRKESCIAVKASDHKLRCVPLDVADPSALSQVYPGAFANAACTKPLAIGGVGCKLPKYAYSVSTCGPLTIAVYGVTKVVTSAYVQSGPTCMAVPIPTGYLAYEVGAEVPASAFEKLEEKVH